MLHRYGQPPLQNLDPGDIPVRTSAGRTKHYHSSSSSVHPQPRAYHENRVAADLPHHQVTLIVVGMSFAQDGTVRRTWMIKSSNSMIADAWIRDWIGRKWQADPALLRQGSFRGKPFTTETQFSFPIALTIP
jgi:hypothetical protein